MLELVALAANSKRDDRRLVDHPRRWIDHARRLAAQKEPHVERMQDQTLRSGTRFRQLDPSRTEIAGTVLTKIMVSVDFVMKKFNRNFSTFAQKMVILRGKG